jgi:hypothetical protein
MEIKSNVLDNYTLDVENLIKKYERQKIIIFILIMIVVLLIFVFVVSFFLKYIYSS